MLAKLLQRFSVLLAAALVCAEQLGVSTARCTIDELFRHQMRFFQFTGTTLRTYAEKRRGWRLDMAQAALAHQNCTRQLGGRFWMTHQTFPINATVYQGKHLADLVGRTVCVDRAYGVCAPASCSELMVRDLVVPTHWVTHLHAAIHHDSAMAALYRYRANLLVDPGLSLRIKRNEVPIIRQAVEVRLEELSGWDELDVSWAILGFHSTGTSSLAMNLHTHPELELLYEPEQHVVWEEHFFLYGRTSHLPTRREVLGFNARSTKPTGPRSRFRGVKRAAYIMSPAALSRLARVPGLVAFVVLQDPVQMLERQYLKSVGRCFERDGPNFQPPPISACLGVVGCTLRCGGAESHLALGPERLMLAKGLSSATATFGRKRLVVVDTEELGRKGGAAARAFYDAAAAFVGAAHPFPAGTSFGRANVQSESRWSVAELRRMVVSLPGGADALAAGRAALLELLGPERRALRSLLLDLPSLRPRGALPSWAVSL